MHLTCTPLATASRTVPHSPAVSDFILGLRLAPGAAEVWSGAVTESSALRLSFLAPELLAALRLGAGLSPANQATSSLFCASSVWATLAARRVGFAASDPDAPYRERLSRRRAAAALFPRIAPAHLLDLLVPMAPGDVDVGEGGHAGSSIPGRLALDELCSLLDASLPALRGHALRSLAARAVAEDKLAESGGAAGASPPDGATCLRQVRQRRRHLGTLLWLQKQVAVAAQAEADAARGRVGDGRASGNAAAARSLLREWAAAGGVTRAERAVLLRAAADARDAPADEVYFRLVALHSRWRVELAARDEGEQECDIRDADGQAGVDALLELAARHAVNQTWSDVPINTAPVDYTPAAVGDVAAAMLGSAPLRLMVDGEAGARRAAAALVRGLVQLSPSETEAAHTGVETARASNGVGHPLARLAAVVGIFRFWSAHIEAGSGGAVSTNSPTLTDPCPLHEQWLELLLCAVEQGGAAAVLRVRAPAAADTRPILTVAEEERLYAALMAAAGIPPQGPEHAHDAPTSRTEVRLAEARLACIKMALLSRHAALADEAVRFLCAAPTHAAAVAPARQWAAGGPTPPADGELVRLLLCGGRLGELAGSSYWAQLAPHVARLPSEDLLVQAVGALAQHKLYEAAGALLLDRHSTHPALRSTAAKLAALRAFVRNRATEIEREAAHPLRTVWEAL
jgi:hypothetical protein